MRGRFIERQTTPRLRLPQQRLSSLRRTLLAVGALGGVAGGLALGPIGCGTAEPVAPYTGPTTDPTQLYMRLAFDQPAVTLSTEPGYNTLQLTVRPLDALGQPMTGLPAPTFTSSDTSRVLVTAGGLVTALKTGSAVKVIAEMTAGLVRHADTAQIDVTALTAPPELASLTIHPAPPDSAIWLGPLLTSSGAPTAVTSAVGIATPTIVPRVLDTFGNPIAGLRIEYSTLEVGIVTVPRWSNASSVAPTIVRPGLVHVVARTTAYGITKADTVAYTVTYPYIGDFQARLGTNGLPGFYFATPRAATVGPELKDIHVVAGAILLWSNFLTDSVHDTVDVTFDDPTHIVMPVIAPPALGCSFSLFSPGACGAGNIVIPPAKTTSSPDVLHTYQVRQFPEPGIYRFHSVRTGTSGSIVVHARTDFPN